MLKVPDISADRDGLERQGRAIACSPIHTDVRPASGRCALCRSGVHVACAMRDLCQSLGHQAAERYQEAQGRYVSNAPRPTVTVLA